MPPKRPTWGLPQVEKGAKYRRAIVSIQAESHLQRFQQLTCPVPVDPPGSGAVSNRFSAPINRLLIELDLNVDASWQLQFHERVHGLVRGIEDVHQPLVGAQLELVPGVLVAMGRDQQGEALHLRR